MVVGSITKKSASECPLPCELLPDSRISDKIAFDQQMIAICVEIKDVEAPEKCLVNCQQHTYFLLQLIFRFSRILHDKNRPYLVACSIVEPFVLVDESVRGLISCGRIFWLFFPVECVRWFRNVVKDIAMINNGYQGLNDVFAVDFDFDSIDSNDEPINDCSQEDDDRKRKYESLMTKKSLASRFAMFDLVRGMGPQNMSRRQIKVVDSVAEKVSLRRLEDLDRHLELYFTYMFPEWDANGHSRLPSSIRENDENRAWMQRLRLLSPSYLMQSYRRLWQRKEIARLAQSLQIDDVPNEMDDIFFTTIADELRWSECPAKRTFLKYTLQMFESCILCDSAKVVNLSQFVAWKLERHMLEPSYFVDHLFPSLENNETMRPLIAEIRGVTSNEISQNTVKGLDDLGNLYVQRSLSNGNSESKKTQYEMKNPAIVHLKNMLDLMGRTPDTYVDDELSRAFFSLYEEAHRRGNLEMSGVLKTSYRDAERWFDPITGFNNRCLNSSPSLATGHRVPFVYSSLENVPLGYQVLLGFLRMICNVTGVKHTVVELTYILLSGINQLKPHRSMSLHGVLLGPPGTGKSRILNVAKAIVGSKYVLVVTYRTAKSNLVAGAGEKYDSSKKMRFMSEFVPPGNHDKSSPLSSESSPEATALKEELDTGITRSERVEKVVDVNTGRVSHRTCLEDCICDNANIFAMNEINFCRSLDSRFVTFEVPLGNSVVVPKGHDAFEDKLGQYKIQDFYGAIRHLVMETSRLNEIGLFPRRSKEEEHVDFRPYVLTWDRLSDVCQEMGVVYGLKHNIRIRERCFALGKILSEIFAVFTVYGCPPKPVWERAGEKMSNETQATFNDRVIEKHTEWLKEQSRKHLHDEVVAESALDPADLLFAFSVIFQFIQKERCVLNGLIAHLVDPMNACKSTNDDAWYFVLPNMDSMCKTLEQKTRLSLKTIADTLRGLESLKTDGHLVLGPIKDVNEYCFQMKSDNSPPANGFLLYAPYAAEIYAAENESKVCDIAQEIQRRMKSNDIASVDSKSNYLKLFVDDKYKRDLYFLNYLRMKEDHFVESQNETPEKTYFGDFPKFHEPIDPSFESGKYEIIIHRDFYDSRLLLLQSLLIVSLQNKTGIVRDDGYVQVQLDSKNDRFQFECLEKRSFDGRALSNRAEDLTKIPKTTIVHHKNGDKSLLNVHLTIFHPKLNDDAIIETIRADILNSDDNVKFENDTFSVTSSIVTAEPKEYEHLDRVWKQLKKMPCVKFCNDNKIVFVNIFLLNKIRPMKAVSSRQSVMRLIMERTLFRNMTERKSVLYVDKSESQTDDEPNGEGTTSKRKDNPFSTFSLLNIEEFVEKKQLPEFSCKNPYKDQHVRNATTDAIDGVRFRNDDDFEAEPEYLSLFANHVSARKARVRVVASGQEADLVKQLENMETAPKRKQYLTSLKTLIDKMKQKYDEYYRPLNCFQSLGRFPDFLVNEGANQWEPYADQTMRKRTYENSNDDNEGLSAIKNNTTKKCRTLKQDN